MVYKSVIVCFSDSFFYRNLFESLTSYMYPKVILNFVYIPKVILTLHLGGKLKITLVYYLYGGKLQITLVLFDF